MKRLLTAELRRLAHRRLTSGLALLLALGACLIIWATHLESQSWQPQWAPALSHVFEAPKYLMTFMVTGAGLLLGASAIGAEFGTRTMASWLALEPRRTRVFVTKLVAIALVTAALSVLGWLLVWAGLWMIGSRHHLVNDLGSEVFADMGRGVLLAVMASVAAAGLAFLTRHTAAVLGLVMGYLVASVLMLGGLLPGARYSLMLNLQAWISGQSSEWMTVCEPEAGYGGSTACTQVQLLIERGDAALLLGGLTVASVLIGWLGFLRRDVN